MAKLNFEDKEYETDDMSDVAKEQVQNIQFVNAELGRLQAKAAVLQTANLAYNAALKAELEK
tara:strand:- start:5 stop:190 length:186 start_codon:yes stop_codon:yes gene_type:complete